MGSGRLFYSYIVPQVIAESEVVNILWSPGIDFQPGGPVQQYYLTYRPARLHRLQPMAESIPGLLKRLQKRALFFPQCEWNLKTTSQTTLLMLFTLPSFFGEAMDEGTIKKQNPKCHLHWCLIEFIDWRYSQSCWYFPPLLSTVVPLLSQSKRTVYTDSVWLWGGGEGC